MRQQVDDTLFASATYGVAGEMLTMSWSGGFSPSNYITETRTYNERLQLTRQRAVSMFGLAGLDVEYRFPAGTNNGRISSQKENVSGEEVTYQYDELNRLIAAVTTGPEWGLSFAHDGFGNRTAQTVTKGTAPQVTLAYNGTTNRVSTPGWSYDANGNVTAMPTVATMNYDGYNRLSWSGPASESYAYAPDNKRVWRDIVGEREELTYYNVAGQRITTYRLYWNGGSWSTEPISTNIYFTGRLIWTAGQPVVTDRLGSVRRRMDPNTSYWGEQLKYFPYGEEQVVTASNKEKFGTYTRDQRTNLDYADQRYYSSGYGRFMTPDGFKASGSAGDPASWNRYPYGQNDPVNAVDPDGRYLRTLNWDGGESGGLSNGFLSSILAGYGDGGPEGGVGPLFVDGFGPGNVTEPAIPRPSKWELMSAAVSRALEALSLNEECSELFGTEESRGGRWNPSTVLTSLFATRDGSYGTVNFTYTGDGDALTTPKGFPRLSRTQGIQGSSATVSINAESWNIGNTEFNAETILHELGHVYNFTRGSGNFAVSNPAEIRNAEAFDEVIKDKCNLQ